MHGRVMYGRWFTIIVPFLCFVFFHCVWVGPIDLVLYDFIVHECRPVGGPRHS